MTRSAPNCRTCQQKVTARGKQGLTCGGCNRSDHFECIKVTEKRKSAILSGVESYLCTQCKTKQRLSLSIVASPQTSGSTSTAKKNHANHQEQYSTSEPIAEKAKEDQMTTLLSIISSLQESVKGLEQKLELALQQFETLKRSKDTATAKTGDQEKYINFTINGVSTECSSDPASTVVQIGKVVESTFELCTTSKVKKILPNLKNKDHPTIFVSVRRGSKNHEVLKTLRRRKLSGKDLGFKDSKRIYINESYPAQTYTLLREANKLKAKGYQFVWVQDNRVLSRRAEGERIEQIRDSKHVQDLLAALE